VQYVLAIKVSSIETYRLTVTSLDWQMLASRLNLSHVVNLLPGRLPDNDAESRYFRRFILDRKRNPSLVGHSDRPEPDIPVETFDPAYFRARNSRNAFFDGALDEIVQVDGGGIKRSQNCHEGYVTWVHHAKRRRSCSRRCRFLRRIR